MGKSKFIQEEILRLLAEPLSKPSDLIRERVLKRFKKLDSFMEKLTNEAKQELKLELPVEPEITASVHGSMIGEISPHHDIYENEISSETPPSYNKLNYNENLFRFFNSKPVTRNTDEAMHIDGVNAIAESNSVLSPIQHFSAAESGGSANNSSSDCYSLDSNSGSSNVNRQPLTENLLDKHNDDMKKLLLKRHKKAKIIGRMGEILKKGTEKVPDYRVTQGQGVKRSGSHSWEEEAHKNSKHQHISDIRSKFDSTGIPKNVLVSDTYTPTNEQGEYDSQMYYQPEAPQNMNTCVSLANVQSSHAGNLNQFSNGYNQFFPAICYIPLSQANQPNHGHYLPNKELYTPHQYMNALMYSHTPFVSQHHVYPHPSVTYHPISIPNLALTTGITCQLSNSSSAFAVIINLEQKKN